MRALSGIIDLDVQRVSGGISRAPMSGRYCCAADCIKQVSSIGELRLTRRQGGIAIGSQGEFYVAFIGPTKTTADSSLELIKRLRSSPNKGVSSLQGEFALCFIDSRRRRSIIAVDRFGSFPVYFSVLQDALLFSSDLAALATHPWIKKKVSLQSIYDYLYYAVIPAPHTVFDGIQRIPPGYLVEFGSDGHNLRCWYEPHAEVDSNDRDFAAHLVSALEKAVVDNWEDSSTACFLSGGLDSSTVCGLSARGASKSVSAFSIGFHDTDYDEMYFARTAAEHFGLDHRIRYVDLEEFTENIDGVLRAFGEPFSDASAISTYICAKQAQKEGFSRVLAGDGGDELFAGNKRYRKQVVLNRFDELPGLLRSSLVALRPKERHVRTRLLRKVQSYLVQASLPIGKRMKYNNFIQQYGYENVFSESFLRNVDPERAPASLQGLFDSSPFNSFLKSMLFVDWRITLADNDLRKVRVACDKAGIEVRFPMLDSRVVAVAEKIPAEYLMPNGRLRGFYKDSFRRLLPSTIINKPKHGFGVPVGRWMLGNPVLRDLVEKRLNSLSAREIFEPSFIRAMQDAHRQVDAVHFGVILWVLFALETWLEMEAEWM